MTDEKREDLEPREQEDDVEGHRLADTVDTVDEPDVEGHRLADTVDTVDEPDVEGHMHDMHDMVDYKD